MRAPARSLRGSGKSCLVQAATFASASREIGVARAGRCYGLVFGGVAFGHGEDLFPVFPVVVGEGHGDGRADGVAVTDAGEDVSCVLFDAHAAAAAVALLAAPELVVEEGLVYGDARG